MGQVDKAACVKQQMIEGGAAKGLRGHECGGKGGTSSRPIVRTKASQGPAHPAKALACLRVCACARVAGPSSPCCPAHTLTPPLAAYPLFSPECRPAFRNLHRNLHRPSGLLWPMAHPQSHPRRLKSVPPDKPHRAGQASRDPVAKSGYSMKPSAPWRAHRSPSALPVYCHVRLP